MKKLLLIVSVILVFSSCNSHFKKPLVITGIDMNEGCATYSCEDGNGNYLHFDDKQFKYNIGDAIK
jgi:hypothetical protein